MARVIAKAPDTVAGLKLLLTAIESGNSSITLGSRSKRVLTAMLEAPQRAAVSSISQLAEQMGVNPSTFSRLARRLGYGGFTCFQDVFRRELTEGRHFYSEQASRLLLDRAQNSALSQMARLARQESDNLANLVGQIDPQTFEQVVDMLASARRVRIHGMRQFNSLALFIAYGLGMLRPDVAALDSSGQGVADGLAQLEPDDVLLVCSCFPYTNSVLTTAEVAVRHGLRVVALTDSAGSPLSRIARHVFHVPNQSLFFSNSMCAFMLLAEGLLSAVASQLGDDGMVSLKQRELLISELSGTL